jgi:hypothetical protein
LYIILGPVGSKMIPRGFIIPIDIGERGPRYSRNSRIIHSVCGVYGYELERRGRLALAISFDAP